MLVRHCLSLIAQRGNAVSHYGYNYSQLYSILQFLTFSVSPHQQLALRSVKYDLDAIVSFFFFFASEQFVYGVEADVSN